MTVTTVFGDTVDDYLIWNDTSYATALAGGGTYFHDETEGTIYVGQNALFEVIQSIIAFDTSGIPDADEISSVVLSLWLSADNSAGATWTLEARGYDYGAAIDSADFRTTAQLTALTLLASIPEADLTANEQYWPLISGPSFIGAVNKTGLTKIHLSSSKNRSGTQPTGDEYLNFSSANVTGTDNDPKLVITHAEAAGQPSVRRMGGVQFASPGFKGRW